MLPVRLELAFLVLFAMAPPLVREFLLSTVGLIGHKKWYENLQWERNSKFVWYLWGFWP